MGIDFNSITSIQQYIHDIVKQYIHDIVRRAFYLLHLHFRHYYGCNNGCCCCCCCHNDLFERSGFLIDASQKKNMSVCVDVRLILVLVLGRQTVRLCGCSANLGFSVRSANRIRPKHGIPLPVIVFENTHTHIATAASEA